MRPMESGELGGRIRLPVVLLGRWEVPEVDQSGADRDYWGVFPWMVKLGVVVGRGITVFWVKRGIPRSRGVTVVCVNPGASRRSIPR